MTDINEVRERLERLADNAEHYGVRVLARPEHIRALLADHARLQKEAEAGRITGWQMVDGLRVFTVTGYTPGTTQELVTLADHARLQAELNRQVGAVQAIAQELRTRYVGGCKGPSPTLVAFASRLEKAVQP